MQILELNSEIFYPLERVGGKLFNLQNLNNNGFLVPETYFYDFESIKNIVESNKFLTSTANTLSHEKKYAVRSSGLVEDGVSGSYAGMFDTYLNVDVNEIHKYVMLCANSINNSRLKSYAKNLRLDFNKSICVIIQEMVYPDIAGVCFTAHPVSKNKNVLVLEFGFGLGDKIVNGEVTPITLLINKSDNRIIHTNLGDYSDFDTYSKELEELIGIVKRVEQVYSFPVDIEWAIQSGKIFMLQARPISKFF